MTSFAELAAGTAALNIPDRTWVTRTVASISALAFHQEAVDGSNLRPALLRAIAAMKTWAPRKLIIPYRAGGWTVDAQVKWDLSNFELILPAGGLITMTATTRQETFYFGYDLPGSGQPTQSLSNVSVYGNGCIIDGNGAGMTFSYANGDGTDNDSGVRFNYIDNLYVEQLWAKNGPIDSMSVRQCRNWLVNKCIFSNAREDNGFSATTDWPGYTYGNPDTYGYGSCVDCVSFDNEDTGFTAYNVSGVKFVRGRSYRNTTGFTMEDAFTTPNVKTYDVSFIGCHAWNVVQAGFYIDGNGVLIDDDCKTWNARGYTGDNTNGTFENGVIVSGATNVTVRGEHSNCGRAGVFITNAGTSNPCVVNVSARLRNNDAHGIYARGVSLLDIDGSQITGNGKVLTGASGGVYSPGIAVSNNGATFLTGTGIVKINRTVIDDSGLGAFNVEYVKVVDVNGIVGDNAKSGAGSIGGIVRNATTAKVVGCHLASSAGNQTFALLLDNNVLRGYEAFNTGDGTTGVVSNLAATVAKVVRWYLNKTQAWNPGAVPAAAAGVPGKVSTLVTIPGIDIRDLPDISSDFDPLNCILRGRVSAPNTVQVELVNFTSGIITPASGNVTVHVANRNAG